MPTIAANPQRDDSILTLTLEEEINQAALQTLGTDGKLVLDSQGRVLHVNLTEKLLVTALGARGPIWWSTAASG